MKMQIIGTRKQILIDKEKVYYWRQMEIKIESLYKVAFVSYESYIHFCIYTKTYISQNSFTASTLRK